MLGPGRITLRNPTTWYMFGGIAWIVVSMWLPWATAARTARVEMRVDRLAELLLQAAMTTPAPLDEAAREHVLARFYALASADGAFLADLERVPEPPDCELLLTNKHYAVQLTVSPPEPTDNVGRDTVPAFEVMAWPLTSVGPGHSVFFHAENAPRAYTRNLTNGYLGLQDRRPPPGAAQRRRTGAYDTPSSYRSASDERWLHY